MNDNGKKELLIACKKNCAEFKGDVANLNSMVSLMSGIDPITSIRLEIGASQERVDRAL